MKIIHAESYDDLSRKAAEIIAAQIKSKPDSVLGLATGSSPVGTYKELVKMYESGELDFSRISSINLDEYVGLDGTSDQSYRFFMNDNLFDHVNIDKSNTNVPNGKAEDRDAECSRYNALRSEIGPIDMQLLGIGENVHIGFNEPSDEFIYETHVVTLTDSTIMANSRLFADPADVPRYAMTVGMETIMTAKKVLLVANGAKKAQALRDTVSGPVTPRVPASILQQHPDVTIIADAEALSLIK